MIHVTSQNLPMGVMLRTLWNPVEIGLDPRGELQALGDCLRDLDVDESHHVHFSWRNVMRSLFLFPDFAIPGDK